MFSHKLTCLLVIISTHLSLINGQFGIGNGFGTPFGLNTGLNTGLNAGATQAGFNQQNTNFQQQRGGSFGVIAGFGAGGSSTNFNQQNSGAGFSNFGLNRGFRAEKEEEAEENQGNSMSHFRYASPYDEPKYTPPAPAYAAPVYPSPPPKVYSYPSPAPKAACGQNLLIGCAPTVATVPCQPPPLPAYAPAPVHPAYPAAPAYAPPPPPAYAPPPPPPKY